MRPVALALGLVLGCAGEEERMPGAAQQVRQSQPDTAGLRALVVPVEHQPGAELFTANCSACHGEAALGTTLGPPLVHIVYEPNHHGDVAFHLAVERGVRAHHWRFGDMPPVPGLDRPDVERIVGYVRWLQREAGVY